MCVRTKVVLRSKESSGRLWGWDEVPGARGSDSEGLGSQGSWGLRFRFQGKWNIEDSSTSELVHKGGPSGGTEGERGPLRFLRRHEVFRVEMVLCIVKDGFNRQKEDGTSKDLSTLSQKQYIRDKYCFPSPNYSKPRDFT